MSESQGYADASRDSADPNQKTCRTCGATVYAGATKNHDEWHEQVVTEEKLTKVFETISQQRRYNP